MPDALADDGCAVTAHQRDQTGPECAREGCSELTAADQEIRRVARDLADFKISRARSDEAAHMANRAERLTGHDAERHDGRRVVMNHRHDIGPRAIDFAVDEAL